MTELFRKAGDNAMQEDIAVYQDNNENREIDDSFCPNYHAIHNGTMIQR